MDVNKIERAILPQTSKKHVHEVYVHVWCLDLSTQKVETLKYEQKFS